MALSLKVLEERGEKALDGLFDSPEQAKRYLSQASAQIMKNPKLLAADGTTLMLKIREAASMGLQIGVQNQCFLVNYGGKVELQYGYGGEVALAYRSGYVKDLRVELVREGDDFRWDERGCTHKYNPFASNRDDREIVGVWCRIGLTTGGEQFEAMSTADIEKVRGMSKAPNSPAWVKSWPEMARKTVLRRAMKKVPKSAEVAQIMQRNQEMEFGFSEAKPGPGSRILERVAEEASDQLGEELLVDDAVVEAEVVAEEVAPQVPDEPVIEGENPFRD